MIVCIDPVEGDREKTRNALSEAGFDIRGGGSLADARELLEMADTATIDCLVTEYDLPDGTGVDVVEAAREVDPDVTCVLFTDDAVDPGVFEETIAEYLAKDLPDAHDHLVSLVQESPTRHNQTAYPLPDAEADRLEALGQYALSSEASDTSLDRLTELAQLAFDVSSAAVGIIDAHNERFLACYGASFGALDREETVCTYTILDGGATVVEDLNEDPRFSGNETLIEAGVRFYAGEPLVTEEGYPIGTLCLQDDQPRSFSERERRMLSLLADEVVDRIELQHRIEDREAIPDG